MVNTLTEKQQVHLDDRNLMLSFFFSSPYNFEEVPQRQDLGSRRWTDKETTPHAPS